MPPHPGPVKRVRRSGNIPLNRQPMHTPEIRKRLPDRTSVPYDPFFRQAANTEVAPKCREGDKDGEGQTGIGEDRAADDDFPTMPGPPTTHP